MYSGRQTANLSNGNAAGATDATPGAVRVLDRPQSNARGINRAVETLVAEVNANHVAEFGVCPYNGGFIAMHKSFFEKFDATVNWLAYDNAVVCGRGSAAFQHVTPGTAFPQYPVRPVIVNNGESAVFKQCEPFMDNVIVLSGGAHVDRGSSTVDNDGGLGDGELLGMSDTLRRVELSDEKRHCLRSRC